jgi:SAM-dependent methyltransferase
MLNVGCGRHGHATWTNLDLVAHRADVVEHDLRRGLPFDPATFDVVYHSHLLEHLDPAEGRTFLADCLRVLKPAGTLRVAVPDLEAIARGYLATVDRVDHRCELGVEDHEWMTIELLDQLVRSEPGGRMLSLARRPRVANRNFIQSRMGEELLTTAAPEPAESSVSEPGSSPAHRAAGPRRKLRHRLKRLRWKAAMAVVAMLTGDEGAAAFRQARFRQTGEVHRWMYDRISLRQLLERCGFTRVAACQAHESRVPGFAAYGLDMVGGRVRKPDSLFMEASKPNFRDGAAGLARDARRTTP